MTEATKPKKTISPIIPLELIQRLRAFTLRTGRTQAWIVSHALTEWLDKEEAKEREEEANG